MNNNAPIKHNNQLALRLGLLILDALAQEGYTLEKTKKIVKTIEEKKDEPVVIKAGDIIEYFRTQPDGTKEKVSESKEITVNRLIDGFKKVNPSYGMFYSRKPARKLLASMIDQYPVDTLFRLLEVIPKTNGMQYSPVITTPHEFFRLAPKLIAFIQKEQSEKKGAFSVKF